MHTQRSESARTWSSTRADIGPGLSPWPYMVKVLRWKHHGPRGPGGRNRKDQTGGELTKQVVFQVFVCPSAPLPSACLPISKHGHLSRHLGVEPIVRDLLLSIAWTQKKFALSLSLSLSLSVDVSMSLHGWFYPGVLVHFLG